TSRRRVEVIIARSAAVFGSLFFLLALLPLGEQHANLDPVWTVVVVGVLAAGLLLFAVASFVPGGRMHRAALVFVVGYVLALLSWPFAVIDPADAPATSFWLY